MSGPAPVGLLADADLLEGVLHADVVLTHFHFDHVAGLPYLQPRHWEPSVGLRVDDQLAYITDTPYESSSVELARGVRHLLHEAWSISSAPKSADKDATAADAARVARKADVGDLTLIHLNRNVEDFAGFLQDAQVTFDRVAIGEDKMVLT